MGMNNELFKVVFRGEIGFDFDQEEVKSNLQKFSGLSADKIDRLFSGGTYALKKDVDAATAGRFCDALQRLGALADIEPMIAPEPTVISRYLESVPVANVPHATTPAGGYRRCPACGRGQEQGEVCTSCGIIFAKFEQAQARRAREEVGDILPGTPVEPATPFRPWTNLGSVGLLLLQCAGLALGMLLLQGLLGRGLEYLGFIILPVGYLLYLLVKTVAANRTWAEALDDTIGVEWGRVEKPERRAEWVPWLTYGLVLLILVLYFDLAAHLPPETLRNHWAFPPADPNGWNLPLSAVSALILHDSGWQVWGCAFFLWITGCGVEGSLGRPRMAGVLFTSGLVAAVFGIVAHLAVLPGRLHGLGASGAIAGLFGIIVAGRAPRALEFPLPFFGLAQLFTSVRIKLRLDLLPILGLFLYANLPGGGSSANGLADVLVGFCVNAGGLLTGLVAGLWLPAKVPEEGRQPFEAKSVKPVVGGL